MDGRCRRSRIRRIATGEIRGGIEVDVVALNLDCEKVTGVWNDVGGNIAKLI